MLTRRIGSLTVLTILAAAGSALLVAQAPQQVSTWASAGVFENPHGDGPSVALADGRTLIVGGAASDGTPTHVVAIFDPATNALTTAGGLLTPRTGHTATLQKDGRVVVIGGLNGTLVSGDVEVFDPGSGTSTLVTTLPEPRTGHSAARLNDGRVLIVGGKSAAGATLRSALIFDPGTNSVTPVAGELQVGRAFASATTLLDGRVIVIGGTNGTDLKSAEIFYPATESFSPVSTQLTAPAQGHTAVMLPNNGSVMVVGGTSDGAARQGVDLFLPVEFPDPFSYGDGQFAPTAPLSVPRSNVIAGPTPTEGYAFAAGGGSNDFEQYRFATIKTDKDDYAPHQQAVITGTGWKPGEQVQLLFQEDPAIHDDYVLTVTADAQGKIRHDTWSPEEHDLGVQFYLTATGDQSGRRAQTAFTDSINVAVDNAPFVWHRTGEVPGGFNVSGVTGTYTCNTQGNVGNQCTSVTNVTITVSGATGSRVITGLAANVNGATWGPLTLEFRTAPGANQFTIPVDGRQTVTATLNTDAPNGPTSGSRNNYFGVDNTAPVTSIQCNGVACAGTPYNANVQVTLSANDGAPPADVSGVASTVYCVDTANTCTPNLTYSTGFTVPFAAGTTSFVRYFSTDQLGNTETTKSQSIQFQANTFNVTFNATPIGDVPGATTVLLVTVGANPAVVVAQQDLPKSFTIASGTSVTYSYNSPLGVSATKQYRWLSTAGTGSASAQTAQSGSFSVTAASSVTATYRAQYRLTLAITAGVPSGLANITGGVNGTFYDDGTVLSLTAATPVPDGADTRWRFTNWTGDVASPPNTSNPVSVTMNQARSITANYIAQYRLTLAVTAGVPGGLTNVTGGTTSTFYDSGTNLTLSAATLVADGATKQWRFSNWTGTVTPSPTSSNPLSITMDQPRSLTANYVAQYLLTLAITSGVPNGLANISGGVTGTFYDETTVLNLQAATPVADGPGVQWRFANWTGDVLTPPNTSNPVSVTMNQARSITGNYVKQYQLTLAITAGVPGGLGNITGGTTATFYDDGTVLSLTAATPVLDGLDTRWRFDNWTGDVSLPPNTSNPVSVTMSQVRSITANYVAQYRLTLAITAGVPGGLGNITGGTDGSFYDSGTNLTLTAATPVTDGATKQWRFDNWTGTVTPSPTSSNPLSITMDEARSITANYVAQYLLTLAITAGVPNGLVNITGGTTGTFYDETAVLNLQAATPVADGPGAQWRFANWTGDVLTPPNTSNPVSVTMNQARSITGNYIKQYQLTLAITSGVPSGLANVTGGVNGTFYDDGTVLSLGATTPVSDGPDTRWRFDNWTGDVALPPNTSNPVSVTMNQARSITANYVAQYRLTLAITSGVPGVLANISGGTTNTFYDSGTNLTLSAATPVADGVGKQWRFDTWTGTITPSPNSSNPLLVTMDQPRSITANYVAQYLLTLAITSGVPNGLANISGGTTNTFYDETTILNLQAVTPVADGPGAQWRFDNWTGNIVPSPNASNPMAVAMSQARSITANYVKQYQLTLAITAGVPNGLANIAAGATGTFYDTGTILSLAATTPVMDGPDTKWRFDNWSGDVVSPPNSSNPVSVTMNQARSIAANYVPQYRLTLAITAGVPGVLANISGGTTNTFYDTGTNLTLSALTPVADGPTKRWRFDNWTGTVTPSPTSSNPLSITMDQPRSITANYVAQYLLTLAITGTVPNGLANISGGTTGTFYDETTVLNLQAATPVADGPGAQWRFDNWTGNIVPSPNASNPMAVAMSQARSITANYVKQYQLTLAITASVPSGLANVTGGTNGTFYDDGTGLSLLAATPVPDGIGKQWRFANWTGNVASPPNGVNPVAVTMNQPRSITVNYIAQYLLTWTQTGLAGTGTNTVVTISAVSTPAKAAGSLPFFEWFDQGSNVSYTYSTPISTVPVSSIQFELTSASVLPSTANVQSPIFINGDYSTNTYTIQYMQPLDQSNATTYHENNGKNGRVIPVKVQIFKNGTAIADTSTVLIKVVGAACTGGTGADPIDEYADAGLANGNTNLFRWSSPQWIYNLDTKAVGLTNNNCYRFDVYLTALSGPTSIKASAVTYAIFKAVK